MRRVLVLIAIGCGVAAGGKAEPPPEKPLEVAPTVTPVAVDEHALEEAFRDHRRRYGEPKPIDPEKPTPIDDVGAR